MCEPFLPGERRKENCGMSANQELSVEDRIANGLARLAEQAPPGWRERLSRPGLDVNSNSDCPAARAFDKPFNLIGDQELGVEADDSELAKAELGFLAYTELDRENVVMKPQEIIAECAALTAAFAAAIARFVAQEQTKLAA